MQKVKVRLPATVTEFGGILGGVGLALGLYVHVEMSFRADTRLRVETEGEGSADGATALQHPVLLGMMRVFQRLERAPHGIQVRVQNHIPLKSGLGAESALMTAGIVGAYNLMGVAMARQDLVTLSAQMTRQPAAVSAALLGGLSLSAMDGETVHQRSLSVKPFKVLVAVPKMTAYVPPTLPEQLMSADVRYHMSRLPLLLEALQAGDVTRLAPFMENRFLDAEWVRQITGYAPVTQLARLAGALAVTTSGGGPAMLFFAPERQLAPLAETVRSAFENLAIPSQVMILAVDTQGIVMSMMQSA